MASINPHIHFNGNAEAAFEFYKSVFGGSYSRLMRFKDLVTEGFEFPAEELNKIMHISLPISSGSALMGSDVPNMLGTVNENENRSKITISAEGKEEADKLFNGLSAGGQVEFPIGDSPWGSYFGAFRDKFGVEWMVDYTAKNIR
jgi:PhnB protein